MREMLLLCNFCYCLLAGLVGFGMGGYVTLTHPAELGAAPSFQFMSATALSFAVHHLYFPGPSLSYPLDQ